MEVRSCSHSRGVGRLAGVLVAARAAQAAGWRARLRLEAIVPGAGGDAGG